MNQSKTKLIPLLLCLFLHSIQGQSIFDSLYDVRSMDLYFASGKADLSPQSQRTLDTVLIHFQGLNGEKTVRITAHTDAEGSLEFNEKLSLERAEVVAKWLTMKGLPEKSIISVQALGERKPIANNQTEKGRALNRRATVEIARRVPMSILEGQVTDKSTGQGVETTVIFTSKTRADSAKTDSVGRYRVSLPKDSVVKLEVIERNYFFESVTMKIFGSPELYQKYKLSPNISLPPAKPGETVTLRNFYFVGNQDVLLKASEPELPKILKFMQLNPDLIIEIGGHVNVPYPEKHNFKLEPGQTPAAYAMSKTEPWRQELSDKRAALVLRYLLKNGIEPARMTAKGYKNAKMLFPHAVNAQQQEMNRRVEITVTGRIERK
ncbi:MAG: OmpA family protein [Saprospiraceae bacterium]|nr:OmpA family protein [Saprospiraceae bacterium]